MGTGSSIENPEERNPSGGIPDPPDWLVGADEGAAAERDRIASGESPKRIDLEALDPGMAAPEGILSTGLTRRDAPAPIPEPSQPVAWAAAASSVPRLSLVSAENAFGAESEAGTAEFPDDEPAARARAGPAAPRVQPPREPWWVVWSERIAGDRRLLVLAAGVVVLLIAVVALWPRGGASVPIARIRKQASQFEGRSVMVHGKVGEVFPIGQGYVFNLHQGRDTVVVFTRSRVPVSKQRVKVMGAVSTGYLDGVPRVAIFEDRSP